MTVVTNQYASLATFSSESGAENVAFFESGLHFNILCTRPIGGNINCLQDTYIDFTNPVNNLRFTAVEPNLNQIIATFNIFHSGGMTTEFLTGIGGFGDKLVNLSAYSGVTRLEIVDIWNDPINENGIGWDGFVFDTVPEPASLAILGMGGLALLRRRK
jgi:hypothetical protein